MKLLKQDYNGSDHGWCLRSILSIDNGCVGYVGNDGDVYSYNYIFGYGITPICVII